MFQSAILTGGLFAFSYFLTRMLIPLAFKFGLLDLPDGRKKHDGAIPLVGGISIYIALVVWCATFTTLPDNIITVGIICGLVTLTGLIDDRHPMPARHRLLFQLLAGAAIGGVGGLALENLGNLLGFGDINVSYFSIPLTALSIAGLCNAFNMIDGIDGLASGLGLIALCGLYFAVKDTATVDETRVLHFFCVCLVVFMLFNLTINPFAKLKHKIFLGDAGSMFLGVSIATALIYFSQGDEPDISIATALWLVAIPFFDMCSTIMRRILKGIHPFTADRTHIHHILQRAGLTRHQALIPIITTSILFAIIGILLSNLPHFLSFAIFLITYGFYFHFTVRHAFQTSKYLAKLLPLRK